MNYIYGEITLWLSVGAFIGWVASMLRGANSDAGTFVDIMIGALGASVGGLSMSFAGFSLMQEFNPNGIIVAVLGACALLAVTWKKRTTYYQ